MHYRVKKEKSYVGSSICNDWYDRGTFIEWRNNSNTPYKDGYSLDKDIKVYGNMVYSPDTCMYVPHGLNLLFRELPNKNTGIKGVYHQDNCINPYRVILSFDGKHSTHPLNRKCFPTLEDAQNAAISIWKWHVSIWYDRMMASGEDDIAVHLIKYLY